MLLAMSRDLEDLWAGGPAPGGAFDPRTIAELPEAARRYLQWSLGAGAPLSGAARFRLRAKIRLGRRWYPFEGEEVLRPARGFVMEGKLRMWGLPVPGRDAVVDGRGELRWRFLGVVPVGAARGPGVDRSALGRLHLERIWLPSSLVDAPWLERGPDHAAARVESHGLVTTLELRVDAEGAPCAVWGSRWRPEAGEGGREERFGGEVLGTEEVRGVRLPTGVRLGWGYGPEGFGEEPPFFEARLEDVRFR
jgi:hypothetical protein